jgi:hypothetical protein
MQKLQNCYFAFFSHQSVSFFTVIKKEVDAVSLEGAN